MRKTLCPLLSTHRGLHPSSIFCCLLQQCFRVEREKPAISFLGDTCYTYGRSDGQEAKSFLLLILSIYLRFPLFPHVTLFSDNL